MKQFYSASELALMKLEGLPVSKKGMIELANREKWQTQKRTGRGGGKEYLPPKKILQLIAQQEISKTNSNVKLSLNTSEQSTELTEQQNVTHLKDWQRKTAEARAAICNEVNRLSPTIGVNRAIAQLIEMAAQDALPDHLREQVSIANARSGKAGKRTLSRRTVYDWLKLHKQGFVNLAPKSVEKHKLPDWAQALMRLYGQPQQPSLAYCVEVLASKLPSDIELPSYSQARRFLEKMGNVDMQKGRMGTREIKSIKPFVRRTTDELWPGDVYTADGHTFDAEVANPMHGRPFRPEITSIIDVNTRKNVGWSVALAESTWAVLDALRMAVVQNGIPAIFYVDNGSGYKNAAMGQETTGFMARLSITIQHSLPYNSQARGLIERSHKSIWVRGAKTLPTYIGKKMDREASQKVHKITRKDIKNTGTSKILLPWKDFVDWAEEQVNAYNNRPHSSLGKTYGADGKKRHMTPNEAWEQAATEGWKPTLVSEIEAQDLFRPYKKNVKVSNGEINLFGNRYFSHELTEFHGDSVNVGYDIHDPNRVWVRNKTGQLICIAEFQANDQSYFPKSVIDQAAEKRAKGRIKRAAAKIEEAEQELAPPTQIDHLPAFELPSQNAEALPPESTNQNIVQLGTEVKRPLFETDAEKYRWLMANQEQSDTQDQGWIAWYSTTEEFEDLFLDDKEVGTR